MERISKFFKIMSAYSIRYQLIIPYPKEREREDSSSISFFLIGAIPMCFHLSTIRVSPVKTN